MTIEARAGSFVVGGSQGGSGTQDIIGLGFQPQLVLFFPAGNSDGADRQDFLHSWGASDGTSNVSLLAVSKDAVSTSSSVSSIRNDSCYHYIDSESGPRGKFTCGMLADGFRLTFTESFVAGPGDRHIAYLALGGLTNVKVGNAATPTGTGAFGITGVGFLPTAALFGCGHDGLAMNGSNSFRGAACMGVAASGVQGVVASRCRDGFASGEDACSWYNEANVLATINPTGLTVDTRAAFTSFDADGFTLTKGAGGSATPFIYVAINAADLDLAVETTRTGLGTFDHTGRGFQPVGVLALSTLKATASEATPTATARVAIGLASGATERVAVEALATHGITPTDNTRTATSGAFLRKRSRTGADTFAVDAEVDLSSFLADGERYDQADADTQLSRFLVLAFGNVAGTTYHQLPLAYFQPASSGVGGSGKRIGGGRI